MKKVFVKKVLNNVPKPTEFESNSVSVSPFQTKFATSAVFQLNFGRNGDAARYQVGSWSTPEDSYTFPLGTSAILSIPWTWNKYGRILELEIHPFVYPEKLPSQRICVRANGVAIGNASVSRKTTVGFLIPSFVSGSTLEILIEQPDAAKPSEILGSHDERCVGVALYSLKLFTIGMPLQSASQSAIRTILNRNSGLPGAITDLEDQIGISAGQLVTEFESLGDNCEFGLLQRHCGAEPLGLFRFSAVPLPALLYGLENEFDGLGDPKNIMPRLEDNPLMWMVCEQQYHLRYHTFISEHQATENEIRRREEKKLKFLRRKILEDFKSPSKIFVYKRHSGLTFEEVFPLFRALNNYGANSLLWVVPASGSYAPGTVEIILPGLYRGHIENLLDPHRPDRHYGEGWLEVCASTYLLAQGPSKIAARYSLARNIWHPAASGLLSNILAGGWSSPESWGIWGVGKAHQILIAIEEDDKFQVIVDLDVHVYVWSESDGRQIDLFVDGRWFSELAFTKVRNSESLSIGPIPVRGKNSLLSVEFRHRTVAVPRSLDPSINDDRMLGMALRRIRVRPFAVNEIE